MRVVGLTGGIGSGKSEVARVLGTHGIPVLDADHIARVQMSPGSPVQDAVLAEFGKALLRPDGTIDRSSLALMVFQDPERRRRLEALTHAAVLADVERRLAALAQAGCPVVVIEAALLLETGLDAALDGIVAVIAPEEVRILRVVSRDNTSEDSVRARMAAQVGDDVRKARCQRMIRNDGDIESLRSEARELAVLLATGARLTHDVESPSDPEPA
jgi:dephospho-CoA kinase